MARVQARAAAQVARRAATCAAMCTLDLIMTNAEWEERMKVGSKRRVVGVARDDGRPFAS